MSRGLSEKFAAEAYGRCENTKIANEDVCYLTQITVAMVVKRIYEAKDFNQYLQRIALKE